MTSISCANRFSSFACCASSRFSSSQNLAELLAQIVVLDQHLRDALLVEQRHGRAVVHGLLEVVFRNVIAKPLRWSCVRDPAMACR